MEIDIMIPYEEVVYGTLYMTVEVPEGITPEQYIEGVIKGDIEPFADSVDENWDHQDSEVTEIRYEEASIDEEK